MNKRKIVVYVSGKYTGENKEEIAKNIKVSREAAIKLWELGYSVITPHLNTYHFEEDCVCTYSDYLDGDIVLLERCDVILMLSNWEESKGARIEKEYAEEKGIPVFFSINHLNNILPIMKKIQIKSYMFSALNKHLKEIKE